MSEQMSLLPFDLMLVIYLIAITAEAMSGALAAGRRNMDIFGVAVIAFVTALGGGTLRDVILGNYPIGWTQHPIYMSIWSLRPAWSPPWPRPICTTCVESSCCSMRWDWLPFR